MPGNRPILSVVLPLFGLVLAFCAGAGATMTPTPRATAGATIPSVSERAIVRAMNVVRVRSGRRALRVGPALTRAARSHSVDMARRGYFDHGAFVQRLRSFGVRAPYVGENLASGTDPLTAAAIVQMWMTSPPHRGILLDRGFRLVGVGMAGGSTKLITADFAGP
jgi:uncharacterized protein YkwD